MHRKLDAIADGLANLMGHVDSEDARLSKDIADLKGAIGAERPDQVSA